MLPAGASTALSAAKAVCSVGAPSDSTPAILTRRSYYVGLPPQQHQGVVHVGRVCLSNSGLDRETRLPVFGSLM